MTLADLYAAIDAHLPELADEMDGMPRKDEAIKGALRTVSTAVPRMRSFDAAANPVPVPNDWDSDFSVVVQTRWPILAGIVVPITVEAIVQENPAGPDEIQFPNAGVTDSSKARVTYTSRWKHGEIADLSPSLEDPVKTLSAAVYADMLAGFFESVASPQAGGIELLDAGAKADNYRAHAEALRTAYTEMMGEMEVEAE